MKHYIFMGALAACMLGSCGGHEGHDHEAEGEAKEAHAAHADEIVLTPEKAQAAGVQVEEVQPAAFRSVIPTSGQVLAAQGDEATVVAAVSGVVNFTRSLIEGTQVSAGMALLTVSSQHIQEGDPVKRARIAYETAKSEYERAAKLVDKQIVSQKDFNQLKENYENARIAYEALSPSKDGKGVAVKSPIGGYVKSCLVKEGDYVTVGQPLLTVTQTRRLQLRAEVSERYYAGLKSIVSANFTTTYDDKVYRLDDLKGRLLSYGKSSGDASYYIPVTFEFDNRGDVIPGSFVEVYLLSEERSGSYQPACFGNNRRAGTEFRILAGRCGMLQETGSKAWHERWLPCGSSFRTERRRKSGDCRSHACETGCCRQYHSGTYTQSLIVGRVLLQTRISL